MSIYNDSRVFMKEIRQHPENFYIIHYSCQSLNDENEGLSPRITSIAVTHYATSQTVSFSTHSIAEELAIPRDEVRVRFDQVESRLLENFYKFIQDRRDKFWIHWNMRNLTYGFEHIEHRFRVLGGSNISAILVEKRLNLYDLLTDRYGSDYAKHPKMKSLMEMNGGIDRHFLSGEEEVRAFEQNEFMRMHNSTLAKSGFFVHVVNQMLKNKLKTASRGFGVMLDRIFESRISKFIGFSGTIISLILAIWQAIEIFI